MRSLRSERVLTGEMPSSAKSGGGMLSRMHILSMMS